MIRPVGGAVILVAGTEEGDLSLYGNSFHTTPVLSEGPIIQGALEEARGAGLKRVVVVSSWGRMSRAPGNGCRTRIELRNRKAELEAVRAAGIAPLNVVIIRLQCSRNVGDAIWSARHALGGEPFAVIPPDDLTPPNAPSLMELLQVYERIGGNVVATTDVAEALAPPRTAADPSRHFGRMADFQSRIGVPAAAQTAARQAAADRYILQPEILDALTEQKAAGGEIRIARALSRIAASQPVHFLRFRKNPAVDVHGFGPADTEPPFTPDLPRRQRPEAGGRLLTRPSRTIKDSKDLA